MIAGDLKSFIKYFKDFASQHPDIKFFMFGSVEKGMTFARSLPEFAYPFMWLEEPVIATMDNQASHINDRYSVGVSIFRVAPLDNQDAQIDAYADCLTNVTQLQAKLRTDRKAGLIDVELNGQTKESTSQLWADGNYGFRLGFFIEFNINAQIFAK